jgi:hypothetical protein
MPHTSAEAARDSIDGGSTQGEDRVSKLVYYRIEGGEFLPVAGTRQLVTAAS